MVIMTGVTDGEAGGRAVPLAKLNAKTGPPFS